MTEYMCPRCNTRYTFEEYIQLEKILVVDDDPKYGYTAVCGCGYKFHKETPYHQTYYELDHHITAFHWLINKLMLGRFCKPTKIKGMVSAVFLSLNHAFPGEVLGVHWEVVVFADATRRLECWNEERARSQEDIERKHRRLQKLLFDGRYIIRYRLKKIWDDESLSVAGAIWERDGWEFEIDEEHRRLFHSVRQTKDDKRDWD